MATGPDSARALEERLQRLNEIGSALSVERDLNRLLERILQEARGFTHADAGTLYLLYDDHLHLEIVQNDTLRSFVGGRQGAINLPPRVPMTKGSASGYAAVTAETLNIEDVYTDEVYRFEGPKQYDRTSGYRTQSMLVVPMRDRDDQTIGVLQLLNATDPQTDKPVAFSSADQAVLQSLASQATVAINNVRLIHETEQLFESFVQVMATALDERSAYTGGHVRRVMEMAMVVAETVNEVTEGPFAAVGFSAEEMNELRIAAWMHDIGKITQQEWIVDKPTKLTTIYDRIDLLRTRMDFIRSATENELLRRKVELLEAGRPVPAQLDEEYGRRIELIADESRFLERVNEPGEFMEKEDLARLREIASKTFPVSDGEQTYLTDDELENLSIRKGSLTQDEFQKIKDHASMSIKMLGQIPFTRKLSQVPAIAGAHHEKLDGSGYPLGLKAEEIGLQARILALVDMFESMSADDRPYRARPIPREMILRFLNEDGDKNLIDKDLVELFIDRELYLKLDEIKLKMGEEAKAAVAD